MNGRNGRTGSGNSRNDMGAYDWGNDNEDGGAGQDGNSNEGNATILAMEAVANEMILMVLLWLMYTYAIEILVWVLYSRYIKSTMVYFS